MVQFTSRCSSCGLLFAFSPTFHVRRNKFDFFLGKCLSAPFCESEVSTYQFYCVALRSMSGFGGSISSPSRILSDTLPLPDSFEAGCRDRGSISGRSTLGYFAITISLADCSDGRRESHSGTQECPQPGLADFIPTYGLAMLVSHPKTSRIRVLSLWWSRHVASMTCGGCSAKHDSTAYASSVEDCMRGTVAMVRDTGLSPLHADANLVKQSMSACMALELARTMPKYRGSGGRHTVFRRVLLDSPCTETVKVPMQLLIGRDDSTCSFEECSSLALKTRDLDAKCVRLTSQKI